MEKYFVISIIIFIITIIICVIYQNEKEKDENNVHYSIKMKDSSSSSPSPSLSSTSTSLPNSTSQTSQIVTPTKNCGYNIIKPDMPQLGFTTDAVMPAMSCGVDF